MVNNEERFRQMRRCSTVKKKGKIVKVKLKTYRASHTTPPTTWQFVKYAARQLAGIIIGFIALIAGVITACILVALTAAILPFIGIMGTIVWLINDIVLPMLDSDRV